MLSKSFSVRLTIDNSTTAQDISDFIMDVPPEAKLSVTFSKGDRYYESDQITLSFDWIEGKS